MVGIELESQACKAYSLDSCALSPQFLLIHLGTHPCLDDHNHSLLGYSDYGVYNVLNASFKSFMDATIVTFSVLVISESKQRIKPSM